MTAGPGRFGANLRRGCPPCDNSSGFLSSATLDYLLRLEVVASFACHVEESIEEFLLNEGEDFRETM